MTTRIFKSKHFDKFVRKEGIENDKLKKAIEEVGQGLHDGNLGGNVWKKRIARDGQGKRSGYRTIIVYSDGHDAFIVYGFPKNELDNITDEQEKRFKILADYLLNLTDEELDALLKVKEYVEVKDGKSRKEKGKK